MAVRKSFAVFLIALLGAGAVHAQGFSVLVSPPRFELDMKAGAQLRDVVEITNVSDQPARLTVRSADWRLEPEGGVTIHDELQPASCRPWVAIERREINIPARGRIRYRFEVATPAGTPPSQCRFALVIEGGESQVNANGGISFPVAGRIAVVVYVNVEGAAPQLSISHTSTATLNGERVPVIHVRNEGKAHGRLEGFLAGTDARGRPLEFTPSTLPILPGETRAISLSASRSSTEAATVAYPITIRGTLEAGGQKIPFEQRYE